MSPACLTRSLASIALRSAPLQRCASARVAAAPRRAAGFRCSAAAHAYTAAPKGTNPSLVRPRAALPASRPSLRTLLRVLSPSPLRVRLRLNVRRAAH